MLMISILHDESTFYDVELWGASTTVDPGKTKIMVDD